MVQSSYFSVDLPCWFDTPRMLRRHLSERRLEALGPLSVLPSAFVYLNESCIISHVAATAGICCQERRIVSSSMARRHARNGMSSFAVEMRAAVATKVNVSKDILCVELADGRTITVPLAWYPRLFHATDKERNSWRLIAGGRAIHWSELDEDISVSNLLVGQPSGESQQSFQQWLSKRSRGKVGLRGQGAK
jgi:hypothetical protein